MAKWGEGDPRWLVEQRDDGHNVNGWHWTEKNYTRWTKAKVEEIFIGISPTIDPTMGSIKITSLKKFEGEVTVNMRKGKKRCLIFDFSITLEWKGTVLKALSAEPEESKGEIKLSEFANHNDEDEYIFEVTTEGKGSEYNQLKKALESSRNLIVEKLHKILKEIEELP